MLDVVAAAPVLRDNDRISSIALLPRGPSRAAVGSSASNSRGEFASARDRDTLLFTTRQLGRVIGSAVGKIK